MLYNLVTMNNITYLNVIIIFDVFPEFEAIITAVGIKKSFSALNFFTYSTTGLSHVYLCLTKISNYKYTGMVCPTEMIWHTTWKSKFPFWSKISLFKINLIMTTCYSQPWLNLIKACH